MLEKIAWWVTGIFLALLLVAMLAILVLMLVQLPVEFQTQRACVELGYPDYEVVWLTEPYCVEWIGATKTIISLEEATIR